jgi:iron complex outermembrane receptor protein
VTTPWAALSYQLTPQRMLYASWGQGVESQVVPNRAQYTNAGQALAPVTSRQSEFGIKAQDHALNWQLAYFSIVRPSTNLDACNRLGINPCLGVYDGTDEHSGLEASAHWRDGAWSLAGGATLLHARRAGSVVEPATNGQSPTNVPDRILRAQAEYRVAALPGLAVQLNASHEGSRAVLPDASVKLPAWTRVAAAVLYDSPLRGTATTWTLGLDNLLDRRYYKESPYQFGHVYLFPGAPRQIRISVQASL